MQGKMSGEKYKQWVLNNISEMFKKVDKREALKTFRPNSPANAVRAAENPFGLLKSIYHKKGELDALQIVVYSQNPEIEYHNTVKFSELESCLEDLKVLGAGYAYSLITIVAPKTKAPETPDQEETQDPVENPKKLEDLPTIQIVPYILHSQNVDNYGYLAVKSKDPKRTAETFSKLETLVRKG